MLFLNKNKKKKFLVFFLTFLIFSSGIFTFVNVQVASAQSALVSGKNLFGCAAGATVGAAAGSFLPLPVVGTLGGATVGCIFGKLAQGEMEGWVQNLLYGIFNVFGWLSVLAIIIFEFAANPDNLSGPTGVLNRPAIYEMWQFIRDFFNLFFILVLLYIAFTVVFQIQKNFKQMILSLIIAALLVNFSFPVSRFMIDATNVPMYFFANQMMNVTGAKSSGAALGSAISAAKLKGILLPEGSSSDISKLLFAIIFMFMFSISLIVLAIMLVIRIVALMILVIFAAAGFAAAIIPGMDKYSKMWWDNFWKYALFGPAAMLMILIAIRFFAEIGNEDDMMHKNLLGTATNFSQDPTAIASMAMFSVPIIVLWFAIGLGQTMALAGGATISGYGHKFATGAGKLLMKGAWGATKWGEKKAEKKLAEKGIWTPRTFVEGWKRRSEEKKKDDEKTFGLAGTKVQDKLNSAISLFTNNPIKSWKAGGGLDKTHHYDAELAKQIDEEAKEMSVVSTNSDVVTEHFQDAIAKKNVTETVGRAKVLLKDNNINDAMERMAEEFGITEITSESVKKFLIETMERSGMTDEEDIAKQLMALSEVAIGAGNVGYAGMAMYDTALRKYRRTTEEEQAEIVKAKANNMEKQAFERLSHPDSTFRREIKRTVKEGEAIVPKGGKKEDYEVLLRKYGNEDGTAKQKFDIWGHGDVNGLVGKALLSTYDPKNEAQLNRSRGDRKGAHSNAFRNIETMPIFKEIHDSNSNVRSYTKAVIGDLEGKKPDKEEKKKEDSSGSGSGKSEADKKEAEEKTSPKVKVKPGERVSSGGIIIPGEVKSV